MIKGRKRKRSDMMGTNYYFLTKDKALVQEFFARRTDYGITDEEYRLVEDPFLAYEIHICKFSSGWRSLFQVHHCYNSLQKLDQFYLEHRALLEIYDEYNRPIDWNELKQTAIDRVKYTPVPQKWVYEVDTLFLFNKRKTLHTIDCSPEEAELWMPFDHVIYQQTEMEATKRFHLQPSCNLRVKYWSDPDFPVDWTEGEFS